MPEVKHYGDINDLKGDELGAVDIITFGSPCFPAGTLILTSEGYIPIENVQAGDLVLTHTGKWQKVVEIGHKEGRTVILRGNLHGLECTPNHPIYSAEESHDWTHKEDGKRNNKLILKEGREWIAAGKMKGRLWATPRFVEPLPSDDDSGFDQNEAFWYLAGRYVGDGWTNRNMTLICDGFDGADDLVAAVEAVTDSYSVQSMRTGIRVTIRNERLSKWLHRTFGKYSYGKFISPWVFGISPKNRRALLEGILDTDGNRLANGFNITTVSEALAYSLRLLGELEGWSTRIHKTVLNGKTTFIEGREVNQRDWYAVRFTEEYEGRAVPYAGNSQAFAGSKALW